MTKARPIARLRYEKDAPPWPTDAAWVLSLSGEARALGRAAAMLLWTLALIPVQALLLLLPGRGKRLLPRLYWAGMCRLLGLRRSRLGAALRHRPVVYVANHSTWLDIPLLGAELEAVFVSKDDVRKWPLINVVAYLGRTVFVRRRRSHTGAGREAIARRLSAGDNLILFPEGTTSDGSRVLPFRSSLLDACSRAPGLLIQPVSIAYDRLAYLPALRQGRTLFAYFGASAIGPHFWRLARWPGLHATVLFHPPLDPSRYPDRKALARALEEIIASGAAALRQGRSAALAALAGPLRERGEDEGHGEIERERVESGVAG
jgi:1-acyl-sn-glycerol-3-phosphate acyltransferase